MEKANEIIARANAAVNENEARRKGTADEESPSDANPDVDNLASPNLADDRVEPTQLLPFGLSASAIRYYTRVLAREEQIDWDEEREAQAALMGGGGGGGAADAAERLDMF